MSDQYDLDGPGIDPGFELGLDDVDDLPPPLSTLAPRRSSIGTSLTGLSGLSPRSAGVGDVHHDFAAVDRLSPPMDLDLPDHHTDFNNNHNDLFDMMNDDFPAPRPDVGQNDTASDRYRSESHLPTPPRSPERGEVDGANPATGGGQAAKTAKKQKKRTAIRDERVEMAPTAIAQNRDNYTEDIKAQNTKKAIEKQNERLRLNATKALQGVGMLGIQAPMLVKCTYVQPACEPEQADLACRLTSSIHVRVRQDQCVATGLGWPVSDSVMPQKYQARTESATNASAPHPRPSQNKVGTTTAALNCPTNRSTISTTTFSDKINTMTVSLSCWSEVGQTDAQRRLRPGRLCST